MGGVLPALAEASRLAPTSLAPPVSGPPVFRSAGFQRPRRRTADSNLQSQAARAVASADPPRAPSTRLPLSASRRMGLPGGGKFFGSEPEFAMLPSTKRMATLPGLLCPLQTAPGNGDPVVRFSFSGDFAARDSDFRARDRRRRQGDHRSDPAVRLTCWR